VYAAITKFSDIRVCNLVDDEKPDGQIVITTLGKLLQFLSGRSKVDISGVKVLVIDEADFFFSDSRNIESLKKIHSQLNNEKI